MARCSIIIPTLNEASWLPQLLTSLQTNYPKTEIIVVDGGSSDTTVALAKGIPSVRVITTHKGIAHQRNLGAKSAKSNCLLFLDSDVFLNNSILNTLLAFKTRTNADIVLPLYAVPHTAHWAVKLLFWTLSVAIWISQWGPIPAGGGQCILITKAAFTKLGGFNESLRITEDLDFIRRAGKAGLTVRVAPIWLTVSDRRFTPKDRWKTIWLYIKMSWWFVFNQHHHKSLGVTYQLGHHQTIDAPVPPPTGQR